MDVRYYFVLITAVFFVSACAPPKTSSTVFPEGSSEGSSQGGQCDFQKIENQFLVQWADGSITVETGYSAEQFKAEFIEPNLDRIQYVEFDKLIKRSEPSSDEFIQPSFNQVDNWHINNVRAASAWSQGVTGRGVVVAVVDAPMDRFHPQLRPRVAVNLAELNGRPGVDDDGNGFVDDIYGWDFFKDQPDPELARGADDHGSHVAGIIAADHASGDVRGIAPGASLLPVNFMSSSGEGTLSGAIQSLKYAADRGARIINASWGGATCSKTLQDIIAGLGARNILFVAASGNEGTDFDMSSRNWVYPAVYNFSHQITVAATNRFDYMTSFSNRSFSRVHLTAPGFEVWSTVSGGYYPMSGTSMAAPVVSGAAALLLSDRPSATPQQVRAALISSVDLIPGKESKTLSRGRLNIERALQEIRRLVP